MLLFLDLVFSYIKHLIVDWLIFSTVECKSSECTPSNLVVNKKIKLINNSIVKFNI